MSNIKCVMCNLASSLRTVAQYCLLHVCLHLPGMFALHLLYLKNNEQKVGMLLKNNRYKRSRDYTVNSDNFSHQFFLRFWTKSG